MINGCLPAFRLYAPRDLKSNSLQGFMTEKGTWQVTISKGLETLKLSYAGLIWTQSSVPAEVLVLSSFSLI
jgi:hypothetical protein